MPRERAELLGQEYLHCQVTHWAWIRLKICGESRKRGSLKGSPAPAWNSWRQWPSQHGQTSCSLHCAIWYPVCHYVRGSVNDEHRMTSCNLLQKATFYSMTVLIGFVMLQNVTFYSMGVRRFVMLQKVMFYSMDVRGFAMLQEVTFFSMTVRGFVMLQKLMFYRVSHKFVLTFDVQRKGDTFYLKVFFHHPMCSSLSCLSEFVQFLIVMHKTWEQNQTFISPTTIISRAIHKLNAPCQLKTPQFLQANSRGPVNSTGCKQTMN